MDVTEIEAKSILNKHKTIDSWFLSRYGMNIYRGCSHNCAYCDGRAEGYYVEGEFGKDIVVKTNAPELLRRALDPHRKRKLLKKSFIMIGGGVGDSYQPLEKRYELTRKVLEVIEEFNYPVHLLTKSSLAERDIDILKNINRKCRVIFSMSFSSADDNLSKLFEPGCSPPSHRFKTLTRIKNEGIPTGIFLMPVIPLVTDSHEFIEKVMIGAKESGVDFVQFGGMTLKDGRQKKYFLDILQKYYPDKVSSYEELYPGDKWGSASSEYYTTISREFNRAAKKYKIPRKIPTHIYNDILDENDLVKVILENLDYLLRSDGRPSPYKYSAWSVSKLNEPVSQVTDLTTIKGVGKTTEKIINEILQTGTSKFFESILY